MTGHTPWREVCPYKVYVVVDRAFGSRLSEIAGSGPVWLIDSEYNRPVAEAWWRDNPGVDERTGVTVFKDYADTSMGVIVSDVLESVECHHGLFSGRRSNTVLVICGMQPSEELKAILRPYDFEVFEELAEGFQLARATLG